MQLIDSFRIPFSTLVSYIPVIATVVTTFFSVILARATLRYVEATDRHLELAREEFEREWNPDLHIKMERVSESEARVIVTNLAKTSVLLQLLQLRKLSHATPFERCRLNDPLVGGMTWTQEMGKRLIGCTGYEFEGPIAAAMTFYAAGRMYRTDWFRSQIVVREGRIVSLEPSTMPTRRVRQIERKGQAERRREFVQDVATSGAAEKEAAKPEEKSFPTGAGCSRSDCSLLSSGGGEKLSEGPDESMQDRLCLAGPGVTALPSLRPRSIKIMSLGDSPKRPSAEVELFPFFQFLTRLLQGRFWPLHHLSLAP